MVTASLACARSSTRAALATLLSKVTDRSGTGTLASPRKSPNTTRLHEPGIFGQPVRHQTRVSIIASCFCFFSAGNLA
jgi:hypothetical protein